MSSHSGLRGFLASLGRAWPIASIAIGLLATDGARAATYYVATTGLDTNAGSSGSPWKTLNKAASVAAAGDTVNVASGTYNVYDPSFNSSTYAGTNSASYTGVVVKNSGTSTAPITFVSTSWHGAVLTNTTNSQLVEPLYNSSNNPTSNFITWQGFDFGSTPYGGDGAVAIWDGWKMLDDEFVSNGGLIFNYAGTSGFISTPDGCLVQRCLFSDEYQDSFIISGYGTQDLGYVDLLANASLVDNVIRRGNRSNYWPSNNTGNKCSWTSNFLENDVTAYDNQGSSLWFDTANESWTVENSCMFANHAGSFDWYGSPGSPTTENVTPLSAGVDTEANQNGSFLNNTTYNNLTGGLDDFDSGNGYGVSTSGLTITGNSFNYDGIQFRDIEGGPGNPTRGLGPANVSNNTFKMGNYPPGVAFGWGGSNYLLGYPGPYYGINFDYNTYQADSGYAAAWANWYYWAGGTNTPENAYSFADLQNASTFNQDHHSTVGTVSFRSSPVNILMYPNSSATAYFPSNAFSMTGASIHQINDANGSTSNTIDGALAGHSVGQSITIPVSAHTPISGTTCEVYDLNGRWLALTVNSGDQATFLAAVPPYVTCTTGNATTTYSIPVTINSLSTYGETATYTPGGSAPAAPTGLTATGGNAQVTLNWTASAGATSYNVYRGTTSGGESGTPIYTGITGTTKVDTGLTNGTTYYYKVAAVNGSGTSGYSNEASATPTSGTYTGTLSGSEVTAATSTYALTTLGTTDWAHWNDVGGGAPYVHKSTGGSKISDVTKVGGGTTYGQWHSTARNVSWTDGSAASNPDDQNYIWCNGTTGQGWTFTAPADNTTSRTLFVLCGGDGADQIKFNAHLSDDTGNIVDYTNTQVTTVSVNTYLYTLTYKAAGTSQNVKVTLTKNDALSGDSVDLVAAWLVTNSAPAAPTGLTATPNGSAAVQLSWTASGGATSYNVYRGTTAGGESGTAIATGVTGTTYNNTGLTNGTTYYYKVAAVNGSGTSGMSNEASATPVAGSISGSEVTAATTTYALTTLGTTDWAHWSDTGGGAPYIHKSTGGSKISDVTKVGGSTTYGQWHATFRNVSWTDGTAASNPDDQNYIWNNGTTGQGWSFTVPAGTGTQTLNVLCGTSATTKAMKLVAHLSDSSATDYTSTLTSTATVNTYLYTITYNSAAPGKTLTITLTNNDTLSTQSTDLMAAWLH